MIDLERVVKKAEEKGASQVEAFFVNTIDKRIVIRKGEIKIGEEKIDSGLGIRIAVKRDGGFSTGFAYTTEFTQGAIEKTIERSIKVALAKEPDPYFESFQHAKTLRSVERIHDARIAEMEPLELAQLAIHQVEVASQDERVNVVDGTLLPRVQDVAIANSLGVQGGYKTTNFYSSIEVVAKESDSVGTGYDDHSSCFYSESEALKVAENASSLALSQLHAKPIKSGKMDIIVNPHGLASLLVYTLIEEVGADLVQTKKSPFVGKLNQQVASKVLTIHDDGRLPNACGSKVFDDEGCPTTRKTIIEGGVLRTFLHNTYTANKENVESTGNSSRSPTLATVPKYTLEPFVGPTNVVVEPGTKSLESMIGEVQNGLLIWDFLGAHTSNTETGDFSLFLYGAFKIERGEVKHPVKEAMVGGNILDFLKSVLIIGNDVKQVQPYHMALLRDVTVISPSILIKDMAISG